MPRIDAAEVSAPSGFIAVVFCGENFFGSDRRAIRAARQAVYGKKNCGNIREIIGPRNVKQSAACAVMNLNRDGPEHLINKFDADITNTNIDADRAGRMRYL